MFQLGNWIREKSTTTFIFHWVNVRNREFETLDTQFSTSSTQFGPWKQSNRDLTYLFARFFQKNVKPQNYPFPSHFALTVDSWHPNPFSLLQFPSHPIQQPTSLLSTLIFLFYKTPFIMCFTLIIFKLKYF